MSNNELQILLTLKDKASAQLKKFQSATKTAINSMKKHWLAITVAIVATVVVLKKAANSFISIGRELIKVGSTVENLRVRLTVLTGSVEAGNKVFADMRDLASQVPQTYEEIMDSATNLTAVISGGSEELNKLMPIILDISAATGIGVQETTSQMIRMYSAGAAAADLFRERGVLAALGFQAGVSVSNEETVDRIVKQWEDGTGKFVGATELLSSTFSGQVSMMQDAWFNFKQQVGEKAFEKARLIMGAILTLIKKSKEETGGYKKLVNDLDSAFSDMFDSAINGAGMFFVAIGQSMDILNEIEIVVKGVQGAWLVFVNSIFMATEGLQNTMDILSFGKGLQLIDVEANRIAQEEILADITSITDQIRVLKEQADIDYSQKFKSIMAEVMATYNEMKITVIKNQKDIDKSALDGAKQAKKLGTEQQKQVDALTKSTEKAFAAAISGMIQGTVTAKEAFSALGQKMIQILADFIAEQIVTALLSKALSTVMSAFVVGQAAIIAAAWAPAAALASLATLGSNAIPASAAIASTSLAASLAAIPKPIPLANGGIVNRPTLALIGEAGPEAVVPLSGGSGFGGNNITINVIEPQIRDTDDIRLLSESISEEMAKEIERL